MAAATNLNGSRSSHERRNIQSCYIGCCNTCLNNGSIPKDTLCSRIPVQQHKLLILLPSLPPPLIHYVKSEPILLCKNAYFLTSARKGYFQFTLLNPLANFNHFKENTIRFYSSVYHVEASRALRCKLRCLWQFCTLWEVRKTQEPSLCAEACLELAALKEVGSVVWTHTHSKCSLIWETQTQTRRSGQPSPLPPSFEQF